MKVKEIYLDLKEGKQYATKGTTTWSLESESFKDPLVLKLVYDDSDMSYIEAIKNHVDEQVKRMNELNTTIQEQLKIAKENNSELQAIIQKKDEQILELRQTIIKQDESINRLANVTKEQNRGIKRHDGQLNTLGGLINIINQKLTEQPSVINDKIFISGNEQTYLGVVSLNDGDYLYIQKTAIAEKNEYVLNKDDIIIQKIHVEDSTFMPSYKLNSPTEYDTPTATINYTLVFIPC